MAAVPPTPFLPTKLGGAYEDESLLIATQPIFDTSLEESEWEMPISPPPRELTTRFQRFNAEAGPSATSTPRPGATASVDNTLNLGAYLPDQDDVEEESTVLEETVLYGRGEKGAESESEVGSLSHKRDASLTSLSSSANSKKAKSFVPTPARDDHYARRLSRPSSSASLSPPLPVLTTPASELSRTRSAESLLQVTNKAKVASKEYRRRRDSREGDDDRSEEPVYPGEIPRAVTRPSALSRFLAKSTVLHGQVPSQAVVVSSILPEQAPASGSSSQRLLKTSLPTPEPASSHVSRLSDPEESIHSDTVQTASVEMAEGAQSRRTSTSSRVIGFFSDLLRPNSPRLSDAPSSPAPPGTSTEGDGHSTSEIHSEARSNVHETQISPPRSKTFQPLPLHALKSSYVPLTRPVEKAFASATAARALQPARQISSNIPKTSRPTTTSAFASAALARLPPPGKGSTSASQPVKVKPIERAKDLSSRRAMFESASSDPAPNSGLRGTVPVRGHTPGKASRERAEARQKFEAGVKARQEEKERAQKEVQAKRTAEEEKAYLQARKATVVRARPVPEMYAQRKA